MAMKKEVSFLFARWTSPEAVLKRYLENVVGKESFERFKSPPFIHTGGPKKGSSLWGHILNGIFLLVSLKDLLSLSNSDMEILDAAYTLHDINKMVTEEKLPFARLAIAERAEEQIQLLNIHGFFCAWKESLPLILNLIRGHSSHSGLFGDALLSGTAFDPKFQKFQRIIQAIDIIDNSTTLEETAKKEEFLHKINACLPDEKKQRWISHRLPEMKGLLTNIIHNRVLSILEGGIPLLFYSDGVASLWPANSPLPSAGSFREEVADSVLSWIEEIKAGGVEGFIKSTNQGIKVDYKVMQIGTPFSKIWEIIKVLVARKGDRISMDTKYLDRALDLINELYENKKLTDEKKIQFAKKLEKPPLPKTLSLWRTGELIRTYYIYLSDHCTANPEDAWAKIYGIFNVGIEDQLFLNLFDPRYARAYLLVGILNIDEERASKEILHDTTLLTTPEVKGKILSLEQKAVTEYIQRNLQLSWDGVNLDWAKVLKQYSDLHGEACCFCSTPFDTEPWMASDAPVHIKPQQFSNRRPAGVGDPLVKKAICPVCKIQFLLERITDHTKKADQTFYLHLFPITFITEPFLKLLWNDLQEIKGEGATLFVDVHNALKILQKEGHFALPYRVEKSIGLVKIRYSEQFGGHIPWAIHPVGGSSIERYWPLLIQALLFQRILGVKVILSEQPVPPFRPEELKDSLVYLDGYPVLYKGLLGGRQSLNDEGLEAVWEKVSLLYGLSQLLYSRGTENAILELVKALNERSLYIFWAVDRLIVRKCQCSPGKGGLDFYLSVEASKHMNKLLDIQKGGIEVSIIRDLAYFAWEQRIKGDSLERHALQKPLTMVFDALERQRPPLTGEDLQASVSEEIFAYLSRIAESQYKPGQTKHDQVVEYVNLFFEGLLKGQYGNELQKLLRDRKLINSAYLFYIRAAINSMKKESSKKEE